MLDIKDPPSVGQLVWYKIPGMNRAYAAPVTACEQIEGEWYVTTDRAIMNIADVYTSEETLRAAVKVGPVLPSAYKHIKAFK